MCIQSPGLQYTDDVLFIFLATNCNYHISCGNLVDITRRACWVHKVLFLVVLRVIWGNDIDSLFAAIYVTD